MGGTVSPGDGGSRTDTAVSVGVGVATNAVVDTVEAYINGSTDADDDGSQADVEEPDKEEQV